VHQLDIKVLNMTDARCNHEVYVSEVQNIVKMKAKQDQYIRVHWRVRNSS